MNERTTTPDQQALVETLIIEIDELLSMRQGFPRAYRQWFQTALDRLRETFDEELAEQYERKGPRQIPVNRQHRVHIYRQRLHAQHRYLESLIAKPNSSDT